MDNLVCWGRYCVKSGFRTMSINSFPTPPLPGSSLCCLFSYFGTARIQTRINPTGGVIANVLPATISLVQSVANVPVDAVLSQGLVSESAHRTAVNT
jgi:hypothetical protein